jgi:ABC-type bacteriocin/lantibiotic exporter with double-glycine peptidase domain
MFALIPETVDAPDPVPAGAIKGEVRFEHVDFVYPDGTRVLRDITFSATPGEMVALVGLTGAGKTTLVSLIPRFYDASRGRVLVDGVDVRRYRVRELREKIGIVLQDPVLLLGHHCRQPALRPPRMRRPERSSRRLAPPTPTSSCRAWPKGYDTEIAEAGGGCRAASVSASASRARS